MKRPSRAAVADPRAQDEFTAPKAGFETIVSALSSSLFVESDERLVTPLDQEGTAEGRPAQEDGGMAEGVERVCRRWVREQEGNLISFWVVGMCRLVIG